MKNLIISLVSRQTLPNVLFIKEMQTKNPKVQFQYFFIVTVQMQKKYENILNALELKSDEVISIMVDEYNWHDINKKMLQNIKKDEFGTILVNLTGGTKIMSLSVYKTLIENFNPKKIKFYYLPFNNKKDKYVTQLFGKGNKELISYKIKLLDYLKAYGVFPINYSLEEKLHPQKSTNKMYELFLKEDTEKFDFDVSKLLFELRLIRNNKKIKKHGHPVQDEAMKKFLKFIGYPNSQSLSYHDIAYLTGGWFEEYVYFYIKKKYQLDDDSIVFNLKLKRNNELDVVYVYNNDLYVIECKTGMVDKRGSLWSSTLYKLKAIVDDFGLSANKILVTLDNKYFDENGQLNKDNSNRAKLYNIQVIGRSQIDEFLGKTTLPIKSV